MNTPSPRSTGPSTPYFAGSSPYTSYPNNMVLPGGFGATLIGGLVSTMLYGITTFQSYVYYTHCSEDASTIKFLAAAIWILDTIHASFMCHMLYYYLVKLTHLLLVTDMLNYCTLTSLEYIVWSLPASVLVNLLLITVVQSFFAHKIYYLCRLQVKWLVTAPIILSILVHFGFEMAMIVSMHSYQSSHLHWHTNLSL
ncbi:hypothetical protein F5J12DRAFT_95389 [Pisolithus orientalis]|uniref:uncharacterized protein n=1 Tax=Pisolithus orientalis TaxID=936130 RepID=UPI002224937C|nr:uncharacterized protein F5J12DRAFT_95389 [Pisolithus orientalis]KAI6006492.1 hypothetical protein F5J12DRAFT_95389 [Pisolithus orientalis]